MTMWTMIALIVLASLLYSAWHRKTELEEERLKLQGTVAPEIQRELAELRERVKVLERIATDSNTLGHEDTRRIAAEIDALRDQPHR
ncbi:hypothetical protein EYB45_10555 [Erythrobacteraceae bacterium CFH 75059]|uniref:hypothetical protein n=1 Tax=Qipengyuania thermophila TaxID=2509361 RepID=UPI0010206899|nr:hypothetical protein [Qipengyuania thermophila]TCD01866.1 hypothetical protein EYB45_10555 [Erythrobacteraceae bacterium CFH 75059]